MTYQNAVDTFMWWLNYDRGRSNLHPLTHHHDLSQKCQSHNEYMWRTGDFNHSPFSEKGENIGFFVARPRETWKSVGGIMCSIWHADKEHHDIMRSPERYIGVAFYWRDDLVYGTMRVM